MPANDHKREFDRLIAENIDAIARIEEAERESRTPADQFADKVAGFAGTARFAWMHGLWFALWVGWNEFAPPSARFDPAPFSHLNLLVSVEAIALSIFILMSQNRQQRAADKRNHLNLQINMLAEQENSLMLQMLRDLMIHQGMVVSDARASALETATQPEQIAEHIERTMLSGTEEDS